MTNDNAQQQRIENDEHWLSGFMPAEEPSSTENLKMRLEIEVNEQWLKTQLAGRDAVSQSLNMAVERAARDRRGALNRRRSLRAAVGVAVGLAATLIVTFTRNNPDANLVAATGEEIEVLIDAPEDAELDEQLDEALLQIDELLASGDDAEWNDVLEGL